MRSLFLLFSPNTVCPVFRTTWPGVLVGARFSLMGTEMRNGKVVANKRKEDTEKDTTLD